MNVILVYTVSVKLCAQTPYPPGTKVSEVLGVIHMNGTYRFTTDNFFKEGVDEIEAMGTNVIKLFLGRSSTTTAYPSYFGCSWPSVSNLTQLAQSAYFQDAFARTQFKTYVLTAYEMTNGGNSTFFKDGLSAAERTNLYNEMYNLTTYLYNTYNNTGKTFVLANWEGDGMLGFVNRGTNQPPADTAHIWLQGLTDWFNARQDAITDARNAAITAGKTNVTVVGAAEFNHVSIRKSYDWPTMIDSIVPNLHMDLYSFSNWKTNLPAIVDDFNETLGYIKAKCPDSDMYGANDIYLGETGVFEYANLTGSNITTHTDYSDRLGREVMQRNTELALKFGVRYILHWEIFDNGIRTGVTIPPGQNATESQLTGTGIRRADGSYTGIYNYYKAIMTKTLGEYLHVFEAEAQTTSVSAGDTHSDIIYTGASGIYFSKLDANAVGDWVQYVLKLTETDSCDVKVNFRKGPTYGKFQLTIGSQTLPTVVDCYNASGNTFASVDLGRFKFVGIPASYNFKFTVTGKTGSEYDLGIDAITITPKSGQWYNSTLRAAGPVFTEKPMEAPVFNGLSVYPNPATSSITVQFNERYDVSVIDQLGRRRYARAGVTGRHDIGITSLPQGIYFISVLAGGRTTVRTFLKVNPV